MSEYNPDEMKKMLSDWRPPDAPLEPQTEPAPAGGGASRDVIKHTLPPKENHELAEELLSRVPGVDRAELLKDMVALCFFWMRHGNKREEKQACDFLNEVQRIAIRNTRDATKQK